MKKTSWRKILRVTQLFILAVVIVASYTLTKVYAQGSLTVSGTVTSGGTNEGSVNVYAYIPGTTSVVDSATTSSSGTYTLTVNPGTYDFRYVPPSSINLDKLVIKNVTIAGNTTLDEQLNSDQNNFSGTISDQNGNPLPSVNIKLTDIYGDTYNSSSANDGAFSVNAEPGQYALILSGRLMGTYNTGSYQDGSYTITQQSNGIDLSNGGVTQNLVLPIANVTTSLYNAGYYLETNSPYIRATASGGSTSLYGGDSGELITESINSGNNIPTGSHTFQVLIGSTFSTTTGSSICGYDHTSTLLGCLPSATTITGDVNLSIPNTPPAKNTFSGTLKDQNGLALPSVSMSLKNSYGSASTTTDANGNFSLSLEPGSYALSLTGNLWGTYPNGHYQDGSYTITQQSNAIDLSNGSVTKNLILPIANVTATVYNAGYYPATSPTPYIRATPSGVSTSLYDGDPGGLITESIRTGNNIPDGTHTFQLLIGSTFSTTEGSSICGYSSNIGNNATYGCIPSATTITGDVSLSIPNAPPAKNTFSGTLKDQNGVALPGVSMSLKNNYGNASTTTDGSGHFTLSLEPGSYALSLSGRLMGTYPNGHYQDGTYTITQQNNAIDLSGGNVTKNLVIPIANVTVSVYTPGGTAASYPYIRATANGGSISLYSGDSGELITENINTGNNIPNGIHTFQVLTGSTFSTTAGSSICGYNGSVLYGCLPTATTITGDVNLSVPDSPIPSAPSGLSAQNPTNQTPVLVWSAVNNITVDHYDVYRDGNKVGSTTNTTYSDIGVSEGNHTYYVEAVSNASVSSSPSNSVMVVYDTTPPTINYGLSLVPNANGWNNGQVVVTFICDDVLSGITSCTNPVTVTDDGSYVVTGTAVDKAGNAASVNVIVNVDQTAPTITSNPTSAPNASGWYNSDTTISFTCTDMLSGVDSCSSPVTLSEGENQIVTGIAVDKAGNSASTSTSISVDKTAPTISYSLSQQPNANGWNNSDVTITFSCSDALSGVATCTNPVTLTEDGTYVVTGTAIDNAGNTTSVNVIVNINRAAPAPTGLTATAILTNQAPSLSWTGVPSATSYNIYRNGVKIGNSTSTSYVNTGASQGTYSYYITSVNTYGESGPSNTVIVTVDTTGPVVTVTPIAGNVLTGMVTFYITVTDNNPLSASKNLTTWVYLYDTAGVQKHWGAKVNLSNGSGTFTINTALLDNGNANLDVGVTYDAAGNASGRTDTYFKNYTIQN